MSRLHDALARSRGSKPWPESAAWRRPAWAEAARAEAARAEEPIPVDSGSSAVAAAVDTTPAAPRELEAAHPVAAPARAPATRRRALRWAAVALPAVALALYGLVRATGGFAGGGPVRLTGVVTANEVVVAAKAAGRIEHLAVQEGSWVKEDDLVAVLDQDELRAQRRHQEAVVQQLSARLRQAKDQAALEADRARERVTSAEAQLQTARSQKGEADADLEQRRKDDDRARVLLESGLLARQEAERIHTEVRLGEARAKSQSDQVARFESDLQMARANQRQADVARSDVVQTEAQVEQARAELAEVTARMSDAFVRAPLKGIVAVRVAREGEVIRPGDPIVTIVDPDDVWVRGEVEESQVGRVAVGLALDVELPSGERRHGRVTFVEPEGQFATQRDVSRTKRDIRTFGIRVAVPNADRRLHQGMTAYVWLPEHRTGE